MEKKAVQNLNIELSNRFAEEVHIEGISFMGYGILPKFVMLDSALTIEAKAIYAYFCSYTGQGNTAFPGRNKILADLRMNKDAYYRHYNLLLAEGYLTVEQKHENGFAHNVYTIVSSPKKFTQDTENSYLEKTYSTISNSGLKAAGYGFIAKAVMVDSRLSVKAKGLYAYYCAFCGAGESAHPEQTTILTQLGVSHNSLPKYKKELIALGYIEVVQRHVNGRLSVNDVRVVDNPNLDTVIKGHQIRKVDPDTLQDTKKQDTQKQDTKLQNTKKQDTQKADRNKKQDKKNNKNNQEQKINHQQRAAAVAATEGWKDISDEISINNQLWDKEAIPVEWAGNRPVMEKAVHILTNYENRIKEADPETEPGSPFLLFVEALIDMLSSRKDMTLAGDQITAPDILTRLNRYVHRSFSRDALSLYEFEELVLESYENGCREHAVKNPLGYCKACIWTILKTGDAGIRAQISHDLGY